MVNKYINYTIGIIVMIVFTALSYNNWKEANLFGHAASCGITFTVGVLFLKQLVTGLFFKPKEEKVYNGKRKDAKKKLNFIKKFFKKKDE